MSFAGFIGVVVLASLIVGALMIWWEHDLRPRFYMWAERRRYHREMQRVIDRERLIRLRPIDEENDVRA